MSRHVSRFVAALWAGAIVAYASPAAAQVTCATLTSGSSVPVSGTKGTQACFQITVPEEQTSLSVTLSSGSGNADLYVRFGTVPTTRSYDCRSTSKTSRERCEITTPAAGVWYVLVQAYTNFSGVTLGATYDGPSSVTTLTNGVPATGLGASTGGPLYFKIQVPASRSSLRFSLAVGTGNPDLYVRPGALPSLRSYACKSATRSGNETCTITAPASGTWYVMVNPATTFDGASLTATYSGAGGLILVSGGGQVGAVNTSLPRPVVVRLEQGAGTPIADALVHFDVTAGGGTLTASTATTAADGTASVGWTLGLARTPQQLTVSARDLDGNPLTLTVTASPNGPLVVNSLADSATPPAGQVTLRLAWDVATSGETISFATALDGQTILLDVVGEPHSVLKGELYDATTQAFLGYTDRDYGKSALYAKRNVVLDASALTKGVTLRWNGGDASHARVLAVYGDLTMTNVNVSSGYSFSEAITPSTPQPFTLARGGGVAVWGTARLTRCRVVGNTVASPPEVSGRDLAAYGGGIYANGLNLVDCVVSGNSAIAGGAGGGGIYSVGGADKTTGTGNETYLDRCAVTGNFAQGSNAYGGGIFTLSGGPNNLATMHISNSTIARNFVEQPPGAPMTFYYRGGGIYMGGGSLELVASTVAENDVKGKLKLNSSGQPNLGGGGVGATIGNAHTVEYVWVQNSIIVGNAIHEVQTDGSAIRRDEDWFAGSLIEFNSGGYNLVGQIDFRWILVPIPAWMDLSRKHWPKTGDNEEPVALADALDVANVQLDATVTSLGKAGGQAVLWYPPGPKAIDKVPLSAYSVQNVYGGYTGYGTSTDDFLNHVVAKVQSKYPTLVLSSAFASQDRTGITWYGPARTWPSEPANANWIAFWRALDSEIGTQLGMEYLADDFWGSFTTGPLDAYRTITINRTSTSYVHEPWDQTYRARPQGTLVDIGAIEK